MSKLNFKPEIFFDLAGFPHRGIFEGIVNVWEVLPRIKEYLKENIKPNVSKIRHGRTMVEKTIILENGAVIHEGSFFMDDNIQLGSSVVIEPGALIYGPSIIGDGSVVRQGAYIRGAVIIGKNCVVGHTTEMKSAIMTGESKAGHFAYLGDSIIGKVNLGAGTKLANFKVTEDNINVLAEGNKISTGLRKFGAILGDGVSTGCNSVTMPGTLLGKNCLLYPNTTARGFYAGLSIIKLNQSIAIKERK
ncbi:MAG: glucose-1-phosphate thymidylyltransferase [bacterium]